MSILIRPIITEQAVAESNKGRYVFEVKPGATKTEIKKTLEKQFKVEVIKVQTLMMPGKKYRSGKRWIIRQKNDWKKAIISLKSGQKIEIADVPGATQK